jgi:hypothetical protein
MRASARLLELVDAESETVSAQVAQRILTDQGILKSDQAHANVSVALSVGYIVDLQGPTHTTLEGRDENKPTISTVSDFE